MEVQYIFNTSCCHLHSFQKNQLVWKVYLLHFQFLYVQQTISEKLVSMEGPLLGSCHSHVSVMISEKLVSMEVQNRRQTYKGQSAYPISEKLVSMEGSQKSKLFYQPNRQSISEKLVSMEASYSIHKVFIVFHFISEKLVSMEVKKIL